MCEKDNIVVTEVHFSSEKLNEIRNEQLYKTNPSFSSLSSNNNDYTNVPLPPILRPTDDAFETTVELSDAMIPIQFVTNYVTITQSESLSITLTAGRAIPLSNGTLTRNFQITQDFVPKSVDSLVQFLAKLIRIDNPDWNALGQPRFLKSSIYPGHIAFHCRFDCRINFSPNLAYYIGLGDATEKLIFNRQRYDFPDQPVISDNFTARSFTYFLVLNDNFNVHYAVGPNNNFRYFAKFIIVSKDLFRSTEGVEREVFTQQNDFTSSPLTLPLNISLDTLKISLYDSNYNLVDFTELHWSFSLRIVRKFSPPISQEMNPFVINKRGRFL